MKKNLFTIAAALLLSLSAWAGPAYPGRIDYTQPDGTTIGIYLHGDEFGNWATNEAGELIEQDENGFWKVAGPTRMTPARIREEAAERRAAANAMFRASASSQANFGSPRIPVILVGFSDKQFTKSKEDFEALLNQQGYSANSAIGSVYDYFNENSLGQFTPQFEVLGPVNVSNNRAYYGAKTDSSKDTRPESLLVDAAALLDSSVDFSRYDNDGDGTVEFIMFYFAGEDQAQGGITDCIWSHAYWLSASSYTSSERLRKFDGVLLDHYFCTAEMYGGNGSTQLCRIGTTCHEFAHTLGLPDFYDTDDTDNGSAANMYDLDIMAGGSYNGNSTTPPYFNAEELTEIGWLGSIPELTGGSFSLPPVNAPGATAYHAYKSRTKVTNEYFVYETRGGQHWDAAMPEGMLVYHVDKSTNKITTGVTASSVWSNNLVNAYSSHPCCYVVPASNPSSTAEYTGSPNNAVFPGGRTVRNFTPKAWSGNTTGFQLTDIYYSDRTVTFNVLNSNTLGIAGSVFDSDGNPIAGASITITPTAANQAVKGRTSGPFSFTGLKIFSSRKNTATRTRASVIELTTDADGYYSATLEEAGTFEVTAAKEGYVSQTAVVTVSSIIETTNFYLMREGEEAPSDIIPFPDGEDLYRTGANINSLTGQNQFPVSEMGKYAGKQIKSISFYLCGEAGTTTVSDVYAIIDYDQTRMATVRASDEDLNVSGWTTVDLRDQELIIPNDKDIFAGCGVSNWSTYDTFDGTKYYLMFGAYYFTMEDEDGNTVVPDWAANGWPYRGYASELNLTTTEERYDWDLVFRMYLTIGDYEAPDTGYNFIEDPKGGNYSAGDVFTFRLVETNGDRKPAGTVSWYFDDEPVSAESVTLTSGHHLVEARFTTAEGKQKTVELEIEVD